MALQVFEQFCPIAGNANSLVAESETDINAKWSFKVIYFGIVEEPQMATNVINVALDVKVRKI